MKRMLLAATAALALTAIMANGAAAQAVTGSVTVTGQVPSQCSVVTGGTAGGQTLAPINFGGTTDLADAQGHLAAFGPFTTSATLGNFQVNCNKANPSISIVATAMTAGGAAPPSGYANTINYNAHAAYLTTAPSTVTQTAASGATATTGTLGAGLYLQNVANNVVVSADGFATAGGAGNILVAGSYNGLITVTITPA